MAPYYTMCVAIASDDHARIRSLSCVTKPNTISRGGRRAWRRAAARFRRIPSCTLELANTDEQRCRRREPAIDEEDSAARLPHGSGLTSHRRGIAPVSCFRGRPTCAPARGVGGIFLWA